MGNKLKVFLFIVLIYECNAQFPILGNILSTAHEHVKAGVEGVAGAVLGGLNFNLGGHFGFNKQNPSQGASHNGPEETIIVVVEESDQNNNGPAQPHYDNQGPPFHRGPPPHHNQRPPLHHGPPPHHNQGPPLHHGPPPPPPPHHHHQHHHYQQRPYDEPTPGYNDQSLGQNEYENNQGNSGDQENGNNFSGNNQNTAPQDKNNENTNINGYQPNLHSNKENQANNNQNYNSPDKKPFYDNPTTESTKTSVFPKDDDINKDTKTTSDDIPLFVPLNPEEYVYGGDKINISAPKRDTEKSEPAESDDDFAIDIRLKDS